MKKEIKHFLFLIWFLLIHIAGVYAQEDTAKAKKYSMKIAGDVIFDNTSLLYVTPGWTNVFGFETNIIIQNRKNTGIMCGVSYRYQGAGYDDWGFLCQYVNIAVDYRKDTKIIYYGIGINGEFLTGDNIFEPPVNPNLNFNKFNLGINGFIGISKTISKKLNLFVQGEILKDLLSGIVPFGRGFSNYGFAIGLDYQLK